MGALNDILGFAGKTADAVLLGGTVGKTKRRNAFADMLESGDYQGAEQLALRNGEGAYAQLAQQKGQAQTGAAQKRQQDQAAILGRIAQYGDSLPAEARLGYAQSIAPILQSQFDLDEEDVQAIMQAAQVPQGFGALAAAFIDPNQQIQNSFEDRKITETGRSNMAGERLRGGELAVSQGNLGLNRDKFGEDVRQYDLTRADNQAALAAKNAPNPQEQQGTLRELQAREQRLGLIETAIDRAIKQTNPTNTGPIAGNNPFATNLQGTLDTIKANIGFEELQRMRDMSPTGGALGQVTEKEIAFLQSVLGSLARSQGQRQLDQNLMEAKRQIRGSFDRIKQAYEADYGVSYDGGGQQGGADVDALLRKYGVQ